MSNASRIIFVKTSSLGDVVHQMPAITDARRANPEARFTWVVEEAFAPLVRLHPAIDEVVSVASRRWRSNLLSRQTWSEIGEVRRQLQSIAAMKIVDTQGLMRSALIASVARGEHHGYDWSSIREPLASTFYDVKHTVSRSLHAVTRNRKLTALSLGYIAGDEIDYGLSASAARDQRYAVLLHGTSKASKERRESHWIGMGQWLRRQGLDVLLPWGSERERLRCQRLAAAIPGSRILERQPLDQVADIIANATLVVGVDTGLLHLAAAYAVPLVAIFLATDPGLTGPVGPGPIVVLGGKDQQPAFAEAISAAEKLGPVRA